MKFEKRNFMGIELDVLVGHPEHDLLFVATQAARAAGLKSPSQSISLYLKTGGEAEGTIRASEAGVYKEIKGHPGWAHLQDKSWLMSESATYQMLLRGHAPASEPFRKWVTEEVLPSIRKTGKYNAAESTNPIAQGIMDELKCLRGEIAALRQELSAKTFSLEAPVAVAEPSPYEGQHMVALCDPAGFNARTYRELAGETIPRPAVDKLEPHVVLHMEVELGRKWDEEDGRKLKDHVSKERRKWRLYPKDWLNANLTRKLYIDAIKAVVAEKLTSRSFNTALIPKRTKCVTRRRKFSSPPSAPLSPTASSPSLTIAMVASPPTVACTKST